MEGRQSGEGEGKCKGDRVRKGRESGRATEWGRRGKV